MIVARYAHPQGSTIAVYDNGSIVKTRPDGKTTSTSATAEKLAAGHGGWTLIDGEPAAASVTAPTAPVAAPKVVLRPMKFAEAAVLDLPTYINDPAWILQQKVDGIRAQLVMQGGTAPWFRNGTGEALKSSTAAATAIPILKALPAHPDAPGYMVDGEILNGVFYAFDFLADNEPHAPLSQRLATLAVWYDAITDLGGDLTKRITLLPTARTKAEKTLLALKVYEQGGEGWIAKNLTGTYNYGQRVEHSLKLKITTTVDCVVLDRNRNGKHNFVLGVWRDGALTEIGCASAIGKPDAAVGAVVETKYLYVGADGRLTQPTVLRLRTDKPAADCDDNALRFVNKAVLV